MLRSTGALQGILTSLPARKPPCWCFAWKKLAALICQKYTPAGSPFRSIVVSSSDKAHSRRVRPQASVSTKCSRFSSSSVGRSCRRTKIRSVAGLGTALPVPVEGGLAIGGQHAEAAVSRSVAGDGADFDLNGEVALFEHLSGGGSRAAALVGEGEGVSAGGQCGAQAIGSGAVGPSEGEGWSTSPGVHNEGAAEGVAADDGLCTGVEGQASTVGYAEAEAKGGATLVADGEGVLAG